MARLIQVLSIVFVSAAALVAMPSAARAQSQSVSVTDSRLTERTIRTINKTADKAVLGLTRLQTNVDTLLTGLSVSGTGEMDLMKIAEFYKRSATAAFFRSEAMINADASKQALKLRAKANSKVLLDKLEKARGDAIDAVNDSRNETREGIDASLESVIGPS